MNLHHPRPIPAFRQAIWQETADFSLSSASGSFSHDHDHLQESHFLNTSLWSQESSQTTKAHRPTSANSALSNVRGALSSSPAPIDYDATPTNSGPLSAPSSIDCRRKFQPSLGPAFTHTPNPPNHVSHAQSRLLAARRTGSLDAPSLTLRGKLPGEGGSYCEDGPPTATLGSFQSFNWMNRRESASSFSSVLSSPSVASASNLDTPPLTSDWSTSDSYSSSSFSRRPSSISLPPIYDEETIALENFRIGQAFNSPIESSGLGLSLNEEDPRQRRISDETCSHYSRSSTVLHGSSYLDGSPATSIDDSSLLHSASSRKRPHYDDLGQYSPHCSPGFNSTSPGQHSLGANSPSGYSSLETSFQSPGDPHQWSSRPPSTSNLRGGDYFSLLYNRTATPPGSARRLSPLPITLRGPSAFYSPPVIGMTYPSQAQTQHQHSSYPAGWQCPSEPESSSLQKPDCINEEPAQKRLRIEPVPSGLQQERGVAPASDDTINSIPSEGDNDLSGTYSPLDNPSLANSGGARSGGQIYMQNLRPMLHQSQSDPPALVAFASQSAPVCNNSVLPSAAPDAANTVDRRPHDQDFNAALGDMVPRMQKLRFAEDMYTPKWIRGKAHTKEGWCAICPEGKWLQLKTSAFWYHKQYTHGISSTSGYSFMPPVEIRTLSAKDGGVQGYCHSCGKWQKYQSLKQNSSEKPPALWWKHAHKCHSYFAPSKANGSD